MDRKTCTPEQIINQIQPHSSPGYRPPAPEAVLLLTTMTTLT
ncbi:MAG: hypothetical protein V3U97_03510 [bacterium]